MRILIAPNAFKGSLTADEASRAIAAGVRSASRGARLDLMPIADGGDGLMDVLLRHWGGRTVRRNVVGPLGARRFAEYALVDRGRTAVVEMARASGIAGLSRAQLDPLGATSFGTGELIAHALGLGVERVIVGMGGSATNDGGAGMAEALGARLLDARGRGVGRGAGALLRLSRIDAAGLHARCRAVEFIAVSDVRNPLLGPLGSARVYGPQKGATPAQVALIERALGRYAAIVRRDLGRDVARLPGGGAAGGLGAGLAAFLGARIVEGSRWVLSALGAAKRIAAADVVLTGEGRLDRQSFYGKGPVELARLSRRSRKPVIFFCGCLESGLGPSLSVLGAPAVYTLSDPGEPVKRAVEQAARRLAAAARNAMEDLECIS